MALFFTAEEILELRMNLQREEVFPLWHELCGRVDARLGDGWEAEFKTGWWYYLPEALVEASAVHAVRPTPGVAHWLRTHLLKLVRMDTEAWTGPFYRSRENPPIGHLETAHASWSVAMVLDLAAEVLSPSEWEEAAAVLRERAIPMCRRWLEKHGQPWGLNWCAVLLAGFAVPVYVLRLEELYPECRTFFGLAKGLFEEDGSYGETVQYANYTALALTYTAEAMLRADPEAAKGLDLRPYAGVVRWFSAVRSHCVRMPQWGKQAWEVAMNFGDSGAFFRPSAEVLLHLATRAGKEMETEAALARWLFRMHYLEGTGGHCADRYGFAFVNSFGGLTLPLLAKLPTAPPEQSPESLGLEACQVFSSGDAILRQTWDSPTALALRWQVRTRLSAWHLHRDAGSFLLTHDGERLLADIGHSCYRNALRELEISERYHNTCSFQTEEGRPIPQKPCPVSPEEWAKEAGRGVPKPEQRGAVVGFAANLQHAYEEPLQFFHRQWFLCGEQAVVVVDTIRAEAPVRTSWHWMLDNHDGQLHWETPGDGFLAIQRGQVRMYLRSRLFDSGQKLSPRNGPMTAAFMHEAYHPEPAQLGEGRSGSGLRFSFFEERATVFRQAVHVILMERDGAGEKWDFAETAGAIVFRQETGQGWSLKLHPLNGPQALHSLAGDELVFPLSSHEESL
jgi:hypothetical protein